MTVDVNRIAAAAAEAYLREKEQSPNGRVEPEKGHRFGGVGAVALGVGLAVVARAVYNRARRFDLERVADKVERKLSS
jgi:hypothetical protein